MTRRRRGIVPTGADRQGVAVVDDALALTGRDDGGLEELGQRGHLFGGVAQVGAAAGDDERTRREQQLGRSFGNAVVVDLGRGERGRIDQFDVGLLGHGLGRYLDLDGARPTGGHLAKRLAYGGRDAGGFEDALGPFGDGTHDLELVVDVVQTTHVATDGQRG